MSRVFKGKMIPVASSNIEAIGFDAKNGPGNVNLMRVKFKKGSVYDYYPVPESLFKQLTDPHNVSVGMMFQNQVVKNNSIFSKKVQ